MAHFSSSPRTFIAFLILRYLIWSFLFFLLCDQLRGWGGMTFRLYRRCALTGLGVSCWQTVLQTLCSGAILAPGELNVCSRNVATPTSPGGDKFCSTVDEGQLRWMGAIPG
jgi:hypothetical protein